MRIISCTTRTYATIYRILRVSASSIPIFHTKFNTMLVFLNSPRIPDEVKRLECPVKDAIVYTQYKVLSENT